MIVDFILLGLGSIVGFELIISLLIIFALILTGFNRGIGAVSLMVTFMLSVYLLSSYPIGDVFFLGNQFAIVTFLIAAFFIGLMFFTLIIKE